LNDTDINRLTAITSRGYTGHEHMDEFGLINMPALQSGVKEGTAESMIQNSACF